MQHRGVSFRHAVELLKEGVSSPASGLPGQALAADPAKRTSVRALPAPVAFDADDQRLLNQVIDFYHQTLKQSPEALGTAEYRFRRL
jgi:hypothetical protein